MGFEEIVERVTMTEIPKAVIMTAGMSILVSVLVFVSTASSAEVGIPSGAHIPQDLRSSTTDDNTTIWSFQIAGVWGIVHPLETDAQFLWLHHDGRLTMRTGNCGILLKGQWEYDGPFLEFIFVDESRGGFMVTRVPKDAREFPLVVLLTRDGSQFGVWRRLSLDTEEGCS